MARLSCCQAVMLPDCLHRGKQHPNKSAAHRPSHHRAIERACRRAPVRISAEILCLFHSHPRHGTAAATWERKTASRHGRLGEKSQR